MKKLAREEIEQQLTDELAEIGKSVSKSGSKEQQADLGKSIVVSEAEDSGAGVENWDLMTLAEYMQESCLAEYEIPKEDNVVARDDKIVLATYERFRARMEWNEKNSEEEPKDKAQERRIGHYNLIQEEFQPKEEIQVKEDALSKAALQEHIDEVYAGLWGLIREKKEAAEEAGKPLLIVIGEKHCEVKGGLVEMMVMDITHSLGLKTVFSVEMSSNLIELTLEGIPLSDVKEILDSRMFTTLASRNCDIESAEHPDFHLMIENDGDKAVMTGEGLRKREEYIVGTILSKRGDVVHIGGVAHIGLISGNNEVKDKYEILPLNAGVFSEVDLKTFASAPPEMVERLIYSYNPDNATQVIIVGGDRQFPECPYNPEEVADDIQALATNASDSFKEKDGKDIDQGWLEEQKQALLQRSEDLGRKRLRNLEVLKPATEVSVDSQVVLDCKTIALG